jgi:hypothetical protein
MRARPLPGLTLMNTRSGRSRRRAFSSAWSRADDGSPLGELLVRQQPGRVRLVGLAPVKPLPLLGGCKTKAVQFHRSHRGRQLPAVARSVHLDPRGRNR